MSEFEVNRVNNVKKNNSPHVDVIGWIILIIVGIVFVVITFYDNYNNEDRLVDPFPGTEVLQGVWIETDYDSYEVGSLNVSVKWVNTLNDEMLFEQYFCLEKEVNNVWKKVTKKKGGNYNFDDTGYILKPNDTTGHKYNLIPFTDGLTTGRYRISASFSRLTLNGVNYGTGNYPRYKAYGYFDVK